MSETNGRSVLVVCHEPAHVDRVVDVLRAEGRTVATERRGAAAAAMLGEGGSVGSGLLVLDLSLPELNRERLRQALGESEPQPESLEAVERRQIAAMLRYTGGNRRKAAQLLGLARSTLLAKIRRYELEAPSDSQVEAKI